MRDILTEEELNVLLESISSGKSKKENFSLIKNPVNLKLIDFKRPIKFSDENLKILKIFHSNFSDLVCEYLTPFLRADIEFKFLSIEQVLYEDFVNLLPGNASMCVFSMDPLNGEAFMEFDPLIIYSIIDRMTGGQGEISPVNRAPTNIELSIMETVYIRLLGNLRVSWSQILDLRPRIYKIETNPKSALITPPGEMTVLTSFKMKIGEFEGIARLCIPFTTIKSLLHQLTEKHLVLHRKRESKNSGFIDSIAGRYKIQSFQRFNLDSAWLNDGFKKGDILNFNPNLKGIQLYAVTLIDNQSRVSIENFSNQEFNRKETINSPQNNLNKQKKQEIEKRKKILHSIRLPLSIVFFDEDIFIPDYMENKVPVSKSLFEFFSKNGYLCLGNKFLGNIELDENGIVLLSDIGGKGNFLEEILEITCEIGSLKLDIESAKNLKDETILPIQKNIGDELDIYVEDHLFARGKAALIDGVYGIKITEVISNSSFFNERNNENMTDATSLPLVTGKVIFGKSKLRLQEIIYMKKGSVFKCDTKPMMPLCLEFGGNLNFLCECLDSNGKFGIKILKNKNRSEYSYEDDDSSSYNYENDSNNSSINSSEFNLLSSNLSSIETRIDSISSYIHSIPKINFDEALDSLRSEDPEKLASIMPLVGWKHSAILILLLNDELASETLKYLEDEFRNAILAEMINLQNFTSAHKEEALLGYIKSDSILGNGGLSKAKLLIEKAFGTEKANDILMDISSQHKISSISSKAQIKNNSPSVQPQDNSSNSNNMNLEELRNVILKDSPEEIAKNLKSLENRDMAFLILGLGIEKSNQVYLHLSESRLEQLTFEIARLEGVSKIDIEKVFRSYIQLKSKIVDYGGLDRARELLSNSVGENKAISIINHLTSSLKTLPFDSIRKMDPAELIHIIKTELPQTIALILSYLSPSFSANILCSLPGNTQISVLKKIACMDRVSPDVLREIERVIERRACVSEELYSAGGIDSAVEILNNTDRITEREILKNLKTNYPELSQEIEKRMFVFEDIVLMDDSTIQKVIGDIEIDTLLIALKSVDGEVLSKIISNIPNNLTDEFNDKKIKWNQTPCKLRDVENAQLKVVSKIREMEEKGLICIARSGEDELII